MAARRDVVGAFSLRGLTVSGEGMHTLLTRLGEACGPERPAQLRMLSAVVEQICSAAVDDVSSSSSSSSAVVGAPRIEAAVAALRPAERADLEKLRVVLVSAFEAPRLRYDPVRRAYTADPPPPRSQLHAPAEAKLSYVRERFRLVRQRVLRDPHFFVAAPTATAAVSSVATAAASDELTDRVGLANIEALVGTTGSHCVLGVLSQTPDGGWALEDLGGRIAIDVNGATHTEGMITEGAVVLATGEVVDGVLRVDTIGLPPSELRDATLLAIGAGVDHFGAAPTAALREQLKQDAATSESLAIVLGEVWLDDPSVIERLRTLFRGFEDGDVVPELVVLMGNFTSRPFAGGLDHTAVPPLFEELAAVVSQAAPTIARRSRFLLLPGPNDPCGAATASGPLPRIPLPRALLGQQLVAKLGDRLLLGSNPCRLRLCTTEAVLFREDIIAKLYRHCLVPCKADNPAQLSQQFARSICDQGTLCPLPLSVCPVHWAFGHALGLEPLPHYAIVCDRTEAFVHNYAGCIVANPGPFSRDGSFLALHPSTQAARLHTVSS